MRLFRFLFPLLLAAGPAAAQDPSNLLAGDVVLQRGTACRRGFTAAQGPGVLAPSITEGAPPTRALSAVNPVRVTATLAGHSWCRANEPSNLQAGDLTISSNCRRGFAVISDQNQYPAFHGQAVGGGAPLSSAGAGRAPLFPPPGRLWCRVNEPSNLQAGDIVMRAACTGGWQPALSVPVVGTASIVWAGGGGTFVLSATGNAAAGPAGGLWCEL